MGINRAYETIADLPREIAVFPLPGVLLLPRCDLPLNIFEPRYIAMIDHALGSNRMIGVIQPFDDHERARLHPVGCAGRITSFAETGDGRYIVSLEGVCRFRAGRETTSDTLFRVFEVDFTSYAGDLGVAPHPSGVDREAVLAALRSYSEKHRLSIDWTSVTNASDEMLVNALAMMSPFGGREKQALLEAVDLRERAEVLVAITEMELAAAAPGGSHLN